MPTIRVFDNICKVYIEQEYEEVAPPKLTEAELEAQYKQRVADLIAEVYPQSREAGLMNDAIAAGLAGLPTPETYLAMLEYRESCKDKAHQEVFGYARG